MLIFCKFRCPLTHGAFPHCEICNGLTCITDQVIRTKSENITTLNVSHLFHSSIITFQHNPQAH